MSQMRLDVTENHSKFFNKSQLLEPQKWILGLINTHFVLQTFVETSVLKKNNFLSFILSL